MDNTPGLRRFDVAIALAALAGYFVPYYLWNIGWSDFFWDADVYQRAVADVMLGENPYRSNAGLSFFYHPVVLYALLLLDRFVGLSGAIIALYAAATLLFMAGARCFVRDHMQSQRPASSWQHFALPACVLAAAFSFGQAGIQSFISGNMTLYLHLALIGATWIYIGGRSTAQWLVVLTVLFVALLVKPYFAIYGLPLWLLRRYSLSALLSLSIAVAAAAGIYLLFWSFDRPHSMVFFEALQRQLKTGDDVGISFFGLAANFVPAGVAFELHLAAAAAIGLFVLFLRRIVRAGENDGAIFLLAYALITFCNPRMKEYDLVPAIICVYFCFMSRGLFGRVLIFASLLIAQIPLCVAFIVGKENLPPAFAALGYWQTGAALLPLVVYFLRLTPGNPPTHTATH